MHIENIITLIAGGLTLLVPIYLLKQDFKSIIYRIYALTSIVTGPMWAITIAMFRESKTLEEAMFWDKGIYLTAVLIGIMFYWFANNFPRPHKKNLLIGFTILLFGTLFVYFILNTNLFITSIELNDNGNHANLGPIYSLWLVWMMFIFIYGGIEIIRDFGKLGKIEKNQLRYFTIGIIVPTFSVIPTNAILPLFGNYQYIWIGPLFMVLMNIIIAYGISRKRFISAAYITTLTIRILMLSLFIFILYFLVTFLNEYIYGDVLHIQSLITGIPTTIISAILIITYIKWVDNKFIKYVTRNKYSSVQIIDNFTKQTSTQLDITKLSTVIINTISEIFRIEKIGFAIVDKSYTKIIFDQYKNIEPVKIDSLMQIYENSKKTFEKDEPIILSEAEYQLFNQKDDINGVESSRIDKIVKFLNYNNLEMIFNISPRIDYKGLLFIGKKPINDVYTLEEINLIKSLVNNISLSIGRAILYTQVQNFNSDLSHRINLATKEITKNRDEIKESLRKERDMLDILGHELRTPLGIAKNASVILEGLMKKDSLDKQKGIMYINMINENLHRESRLLETILSNTKIDNEKMSLVMEKVDLEDVIKDSFEAFKNKAKEKGLLLKSKEFKKVFIYSDRTRIQQVIDNIIDNAIKYTEKGFIEVSYEELNNNIKITISDTGIGISKEDLERLGQKFYRADNYLKSSNDSTNMQIVRPGGTGLGLYVTFSLIRLMGGKISVKSKLNEGSSFIITIPKFEGQEEKVINPNSVAAKFREIKMKLKRK